MYDNGRGVPQDDAQAVNWYRKAAEQGLAEAQYNLGLMYDNGRGVPQNYEKAYAWLSVAAAHGDNEATKCRDQVATHLSPAALLAAQRLSKRYFADYAKHPSDATP
jgi:TPR repeat protein